MRQDYGSSAEILADFSASEAAPDQGAPQQEAVQQTAPEPIQQQQAQPIPQSQPQQQQAPVQPDQKQWEFPWNGKMIQGTDEQMRQWASQGYDYSQKMAEINQQRQSFDRYAEVDSYAKQNPEWWAHVEQGWTNRQTANLSPELKTVVEPLLNEIGELKKFQADWHAEKLANEQKEFDTKLSTEISGLGKEYNIDFAARDQSGQSLEWHVMNHARQNGIPTFRAAFLDYYREPLMKLYEQRGREAVQRDLQERKKAGLLGTSPTPPQSFADAPSPLLRAKGYPSAGAILSEMGIN